MGLGKRGRLQLHCHRDIHFSPTNSAHAYTVVESRAVGHAQAIAVAAMVPLSMSSAMARGLFRLVQRRRGRAGTSPPRRFVESKLTIGGKVLGRVLINSARCPLLLQQRPFCDANTCRDVPNSDIGTAAHSIPVRHLVGGAG